MFGSMEPEKLKWPTVPLSDLVHEFRYGTSEKSQPEGHPTLRIPNVVGGSISLADLKYVPVNDKELDRLRLREGDIFFVRTNGNKEYVGRSAVVTSEIERQSGYSVSDFIYASYLIKARVKSEKLNSHFLQSFLSGPAGRKMLLERAKTSAGQYNINIEGLGSLRIPLPPLEQQKNFESRATEITRRMDLACEQSGTLGTLFSSLQHRAFSGQL
jgi:type I restriction enzyme S subunit